MMCSKCKEDKSEDAFYPSQHRKWCKLCMKEYARNLKRNNPERARKWRQDSQRRYYERHKENVISQVKEWKKKHPEQSRARHKVERAIRSGKLVKPSICEMCGSSEYIQASHPGHDYKKALEVRWLCVSCHRKVDGTKLTYRKIAK
jgi:hypothetical protein